MTRKKKDFILKVMTYFASGISVVVLASILIYLLQNGLSSVSLDLITGDYNAASYHAKPMVTETSLTEEKEVEGYYSKKWGVGFKDIETSHKEKEIAVSYVDAHSPFASMTSLIAGEEGMKRSLKAGDVLQNLYYFDDMGEKVFLSKGKMKNAKHLVSILEEDAVEVASVGYQSLGGGIKGSIIATLYLIVISLSLSLPIGIASAIYLHEYATRNRFHSFLRQGIDALTGVPSIVYGLMGVTVLFPVTQLFGATSTSILLGGLTMAIILLPTIIRSTEEALIVVPQSVRDGSLSLGATKSQTIFKVVLPSAINGILTGVLLGIGRVIGESAALVYTTSTVINDAPEILSQGTSMALMIWSIMSGEQPNFELASAISLIILIIVFAINLIVKWIGKRFAKSFV